ncbi:MAG TPA: hypothetical protein VF110_14350 [Burkholderiales bacterium]
MNVIRHQAVGMDLISVPRRKFAQVMQIEDVVLFLPEARSAIYCPLNNMSGGARKENAQAARHDECQRA